MLTTFRTGVIALAALVLAACATSERERPVSASERVDAPEALWSSQALAPGRSGFIFSDWAGPALPVWAYVPKGVNMQDAPIMFLLHGAKRAPRRYLEEWVDLAQQDGFIIIAPEFAKPDFPKSTHYNLGNLFRDGELQPEQNWSYSAIEPLFDQVVAKLGSTRKAYTLYGHSAGSQFVHRFLFLKPDARVSRLLAANAGWYTFAAPEVAWPFGLGGVPVSEDELRQALAKDVVILLGDLDSDPQHESLNRSQGAMAQGPHRFARGQSFYESARKLAEGRGWEFNWSLRVVPGVAHSNGGIAQGAHDLVK